LRMRAAKPVVDLPDADLALPAASPALWLLSSIINVGLVRRFAASLYTVTGSARTAESALVWRKKDTLARARIH
jgi:hypothetical protein